MTFTDFFISGAKTKMKITHRIPTSQYAYVEFEEEVESVEDGIINHRYYHAMYEDKAGLNQNKWAEVRRTMLETGQFDPNLWEELSKAQKFWINETKKTLRSLDNTIE